MNKYSSKAIKTAATVGMSLAMVLSNAAPVLAAANTDLKVCSKDATQENMVLLNQFRSDNSNWAKATADTTFNAKKVTKYGTKFDNAGAAVGDAQKSADGTVYAPTITVGGKTLVLVWDVATGGGAVADEEKTGDGATTYYYAVEKAATTKVVVTETAKVNMIDYMAGKYGFDSDVVTSESEVTAVGNIIIRTGKSNDFNEALKNLSDNCYDTGADAYKVNADNMLDLVDALTMEGADLIKLAIGSKTAIADQIEAIEKFKTKYENNLSYDQFYTLEEKILELSNDPSMDSSTTEYQKELSAFIKEEAKKIDFTGKTYTDLNGADSVTPAKMDKIIKDFKATDGYKRFQNDEATQELLSEMETIREEAVAVQDAVSKVKNDAYKAYVKAKGAEDGKNKVVDLVKEVTFDDKDGSVKIASTITMADFELIKAFKEEVVDQVAVLSSKKYANRYYDDTTKSIYVASNTAKSVLADLGELAKFNEDTQKFNYETFAEFMEEVEKAYKAVTTDIEKLTPANIKASDKATLVAAEDALDELTYNGDYENNLSKAEAKEVKRAATKIENLREAFDNLGVTNVAGWYDMGNGNWGYNNEDGTPAAYKWVASGADWYMIKDGKMLRNTWIATDGGRWYYVDNAGKMVTNQSVDGCWINSYGVYMSPSYNG